MSFRVRYREWLWPGTCQDQTKIKVYGKVQPDHSMGGRGGELKVISARGLKLCDRVWYNAIYYIAYSYNPKGVN